MRDTSYLVYSYRYNTMHRPRIDASRRIYKDRRDLDAMPPTVIAWANVAADTKREAIKIGRELVSVCPGCGAMQDCTPDCTYGR